MTSTLPFTAFGVLQDLGGILGILKWEVQQGGKRVSPTLKLLSHVIPFFARDSRGPRNGAREPIPAGT